MMEQMFGMLQSMDEASLAAVLRAAAPSDAAAEQLARRVKGMSPGQVRAMARVASFGQRAAEAARRARAALAGRSGLLLAAAVLLAAVLLRWLGWA